MKTGEAIYARTHAEFLNEAFGTNYKAWMKCTWKCGDGWVVWMVRFDENNDKWTNTFLPDSRIKETNFNAPSEYIKKIDKKKIVFQIVGNGSSRRYIFKGKYVYDEANSDPYTSRFYNKVSDEL